MRKIPVKKAAWRPEAYLPWLALLSAIFLVGALIGWIAIASADSNALQTLQADLASLREEGTRDVNSFLTSYISLVKYLLIAFICSFSALGILVLPGLIAMRGYFLAYTASAFIRIYGMDGMLPSFYLLGIQSLFSLPCLFAIAVAAMQNAMSLFGGVLRRPGMQALYIPPGKTLQRMCICMILLIPIAIFDSFWAKGLASALFL